jgi:hypothetical protein
MSKRDLRFGKYKFLPDDKLQQKLKDLTGISEEQQDFVKRFMQNEKADLQKTRKKKA